MPLYTTEAIVLITYPFRDRDLVVRCYTQDFGQVSGIARSGRSPKSKFRGSLEPLNHVQLVFFQKEGRELGSLDEAELIKPFFHIRSNLLRLAAGLYLADMIHQFTPLQDPHPELFDAFALTLQALDTLDSYRTPLLSFELQFLRFLGLEPQVERCIHCQGSSNGLLAGFDPQAGGLICDRCLHRCAWPVRMSGESLHVLRSAFLSGVQVRAVESLASGAYREIQQVLHRTLEEHFDKRLKSYDFLQQVLEEE